MMVIMYHSAGNLPTKTIQETIITNGNHDGLNSLQEKSNIGAAVAETGPDDNSAIGPSTSMPKKLEKLEAAAPPCAAVKESKPVSKDLENFKLKKLEGLASSSKSKTTENLLVQKLDNDESFLLYQSRKNKKHEQKKIEHERKPPDCRKTNQRHYSAPKHGKCNNKASQIQNSASTSQEDSKPKPSFVPAPLPEVNAWQIRRTARQSATQSTEIRDTPSVTDVIQVGTSATIQLSGDHAGNVEEEANIAHVHNASNTPSVTEKTDQQPLEFVDLCTQTSRSNQQVATPEPSTFHQFYDDSSVRHPQVEKICPSTSTGSIRSKKRQKQRNPRNQRGNQHQPLPEEAVEPAEEECLLYHAAYGYYTDPRIGLWNNHPEYANMDYGYSGQFAIGSFAEADFVYFDYGIEDYRSLSKARFKYKVRTQIEYYLSEENLLKDTFLRRKMDLNGYVPIAVIASFPRIQALTNDLSLVIESLQDSDIIEIDLFKIRPKSQPTRWPILDGESKNIAPSGSKLDPEAPEFIFGGLNAR